MEWDYEGLRLAEIFKQRPDWDMFRDGCPGGENAAQVGERADCVIERIRAIGGTVLLFSSGHFLRVLAARCLGLEPSAGRYFVLHTASFSAVGYEHDLSQPVIRLWNDDHDLAAIADKAQPVVGDGAIVQAGFGR